MIKYQGRLKFIKYIRNKPVKWGIKVFLLCECLSGYCIDGIVFTAKTTVPLIENFNSTESLIRPIVEPYLEKGYILYLENYFTSVTIAINLLLNV